MSKMMPDQFPAAVVTGRNRLEVVDVPTLEVGPYDSVCQINACSICAATDSHLVDGTFVKDWMPKWPFVLGHESAGRVVEVGEKVRRFKVGQMVVRPHWMPDSEQYHGLASAWGGFAAWGIVRDTFSMHEDNGEPIDFLWRSAAPVPDMPAEDATLFITWRDVMSCVMQMGIKAGDHVVIFGSGGNAMAFTRFAALAGAQVVMVGSPVRQDMAVRLGATFIDYHLDTEVPAAVSKVLNGHGADYLIEAVGKPNDLPKMFECLAENGTLFLFGLPPDLQFNTNLWTGPSRYTIERKTVAEDLSHNQVLNYYLAGQLDPHDFYDQSLPLDQINEGFDKIRNREAIKITITMPH